ncbi:MAG: hypothetical protein CYG59_10000 [Chloroflexi bacterium]|nr:MAG: hypothetical protein CYG59_10000 [Chloroflexota bacterium]
MLAQVQTVAGAEVAARGMVDSMTVQGTEASGHTGDNASLRTCNSLLWQKRPSSSTATLQFCFYPCPGGYHGDSDCYWVCPWSAVARSGARLRVKLACTIADRAMAELIRPAHLAEALQLPARRAD